MAISLLASTIEGLDVGQGSILNDNLVSLQHIKHADLVSGVDHQLLNVAASQHDVLIGLLDNEQSLPLGVHTNLLQDGQKSLGLLVLNLALEALNHNAVLSSTLDSSSQSQPALLLVHLDAPVLGLQYRKQMQVSEIDDTYHNKAEASA